jgi:membrane glycosyltransferase
MFSILPFRGEPVLSVVMTALFAVLFGWISVGFWSSLSGFILLLAGSDRYNPTLPLPPLEKGRGLLPEGFLTAILFPVYNENPQKVMEGIKAIRGALRDNGVARRFDFFVLSDTTNPDVWALEEEVFIRELQKESAEAPRREGDGDAAVPSEPPGLSGEASSFPEGGHIYYRHRQFNLKRKSGNVADFLRRWGGDYKYMVVCDADSLLSAECLQRLVLAMERREDIGILQTPPKAMFSETPLARVQQFANHFYGPIFAAGLHFWQLGDAQFWGHNAIVRVKPFMESCQLPRLPGHSAFGGEILSHDFVESALMRRAGFGVWLAYDLEGSYEMTPPTLIDELVRDRRWCQGNLQHFKLIFSRGFFPTHRALFINGIMSYGSALLWFFFLLASTVEAVAQIVVPPTYFPEGPSLFPDWPKYFPAWALALLSSAGALLFFPKILALIYRALRHETQEFGGFLKLSLSVLLEVIISTFLAPTRMLFHSYFVVTTLIGLKVGWNPQNRDNDKGLSWGSAIRFHWFGSLLGLVWGLAIYLISPGFFVWLSPVAVGLVLSIPLAVYSSRLSLGALSRKLGLFLTPAETRPTPELLALAAGLNRETTLESLNIPFSEPFTRLVVLPQVLAAHLYIFRRRRKKFPAIQKRLDDVLAKALQKGPASLSPKEKKLALNDPETLLKLHQEVWRLPPERSKLWRVP